MIDFIIYCMTRYDMVQHGTRAKNRPAFLVFGGHIGVFGGYFILEGAYCIPALLVYLLVDCCMRMREGEPRIGWIGTLMRAGLFSTYQPRYLTTCIL